MGTVLLGWGRGWGELNATGMRMHTQLSEGVQTASDSWILHV